MVVLKFFENIFLMKYMDSIARFCYEIIPESSTTDEYFKQTHEEVLEKDNDEVPIRNKRQRVRKSFGDDFICIPCGRHTQVYCRGICISRCR